MQRVRQGPLTVTRDISISFDSMPRLSLRRHRRSEIVKRWELARGGVVVRFTASLRKAVTRDSLNKAKNTGRADKPCRFTNIARPLTTVANHLLLREREGRRFPPSVSLSTLLYLPIFLSREFSPPRVSVPLETRETLVSIASVHPSALHLINPR